MCLLCKRPRVDPWVGKIPCRRGWQAPAAFLENSTDRAAWQAAVHGVTKRLSKWHLRISWLINTAVSAFLKRSLYSFLVIERNKNA